MSRESTPTCHSSKEVRGGDNRRGQREERGERREERGERREERGQEVAERAKPLDAAAS